MTRRAKDLPKRDEAIGIRFSAEERDAVQRAAYDDDRLVSTFCRRIILAHLRASGHLVGGQHQPNTPTDTPEAPP